MFEKLAEVEQLYQDLERRMADPALLDDMDEYRRVHKQYSDLTEIVAKYREYKETERQTDEDRRRCCTGRSTPICATWRRWSSTSCARSASPWNKT